MSKVIENANGDERSVSHAGYQVQCAGLPDGYSIYDYARAAGVRLSGHATAAEAWAAADRIEATPDCDGVVPSCYVVDDEGRECERQLIETVKSDAESSDNRWAMAVDTAEAARDALARADAWWTWHDQDADRHSSDMETAEARCAAWVAGSSDDGPARADA